ncbi:MAG: hypothetical protein ABIS00_14580 [Gemmatimonadales bacterium]
MRLLPRSSILRFPDQRSAHIALTLGLAASGILAPLQSALTQDRKLTVTPELRIRDDFVFVSSLTVDPAGRIAALEWNDKELHFFAPDGTPLKRFGRTGEGPGEFTRPLTVGVSPHGFWATDAAMRATLISPALTFERNIRFPITIAGLKPDGLVGPGVPFIVGVGKGDTLLLKVNPPRSKIPFISLITMGRAGEVFIVTTRDGRFVRSIGSTPAAPDCVAATPDNKRAGVIAMCAGPIAAANPDGTRIGFLLQGPSGYAIRMVDSKGVVQFARTVVTPMEKIPAGVADTLFEDVRNIQPGVKVPELYPPAERLVIGRDGSAWVLEHQATPGTRWRVIGPHGEGIGIVTLPPRVRLMVADVGHIWAVAKDEDDLPSIVRYVVRG